MSPSRFGLISGTCAICDDCGLATGDHNSLDMLDNAPKTVQGKDLNCQMVYVGSELVNVFSTDFAFQILSYIFLRRGFLRSF